MFASEALCCREWANELYWLSCGTLHAMPAAKSAFHPDSSTTLFKGAKAFETWLKKNHATCDGLWLKIAKRGAN
jgi:hypothetical protein